MSPMAPSWIRSMAARYPASWRRCVPATIARLFWAARSADASTACTPCGSAARGFSKNPCSPASIAAARWRARNAGGVASSTRSALPSSTLRYASNPTKQWESLTLILGFSVGSSVTMVARLSRHFARWSGKRSPRATSSMLSLDVRQSFTAPVPRPPQPIRAMRIFFGAPPIDAGAGGRGSAMAAVATAAVSTNARRVTSRGCLGVMTDSWREEYETEADERSIGEPPAALGKLGIGLVPRGRLRGSGTRAHPRRRLGPRSTTHHGGAVRNGDPFGDIAEQIVRAERIGLFRGDGVRLVCGVPGVPGEGIAALGGKRRVRAEARLERPRPLGVRWKGVVASGPGRQPGAVSPGRRVRHGERGVAVVAEAPVGRAIRAARSRRRIRGVAPPWRPRRHVEPVHPHVVLVPGHLGLADPEWWDRDHAPTRRRVQCDGAAGNRDQLEGHEGLRDRVAIRDQAARGLAPCRARPRGEQQRER